ncbi:DUF488 domain-containing protein [Streptomyces sp. NPDC058612]|uniref:DUF488 domain-containing protein n=1 Tax=Streptomyces sp. NPDC058612 TaxID=3346555 RepID=UPI00364CBBCC
MIRVRRAYDPAEPDADGVRVPVPGCPVDRLRPRGLSKAAGRRGGGVDAWPGAVTPSTELRKRFPGGDPAADFQRRYEAELTRPEAAAEPARPRSSGAGTRRS